MYLQALLQMFLSLLKIPCCPEQVTEVFQGPTDASQIAQFLAQLQAFGKEMLCLNIVPLRPDQTAECIHGIGSFETLTQFP